ncbi:MAG: radical SAM protein [Bacteroidales bacterium]|nr:radical SAM protein [Bacteroidales bacterium]
MNKKLTTNHPCFAPKTGNIGRIHLPVSGSCNIGCRFCHRVISDTENRPGVTSKIITPEESITILEKALDLCPEIRVAGIAGPGDTLATDSALKTFSLIGQRFPQLLKCMSTNGLLLNEKADEVIKAGIDSLTVTVNAVDPEIEALLNKFVIYHNKKYDALEGAKILIHNQLEGIKKFHKVELR